MFANLPKFADKSFIIGFYLPSLLAVFVAIWTIFPDSESFIAFRDMSIPDSDVGTFAYPVAGAFMLAVILMTTNRMQYRFLSGYLPPLSWIGFLRARERERFERLNRRYNELSDAQSRAVSDQRKFPDSMLKERGSLRVELLKEFPASENKFLPTRFGNTIRAFESYPDAVYNVAGVSMFLRLASVIPKQFSAIMDDARTQVDCFVNVTCLAAAVAILALERAAQRALSDSLYSSVSEISKPMSGLTIAHDVLVAGICAVISFLAYRWATVCAVQWGDLVKSAFDCFLPDLAKQMGYKLPETEADRRDFWDKLSAMIVYQIRMEEDRSKLA
jgi:hypothetical protein